ncbi:MAG: hypothetical protein HYT81_02115 [Gemmatimonadetes bacterium]|nr:hypothetical protein [Gemmatimonadota bacterium]MBI2402254.1 hypothetical protein [Gemmatimonadota bacterium]
MSVLAPGAVGDRRSAKARRHCLEGWLELLAACCGPVLLAACAWLATRPANGPGSSDLAEAVATAPADVPVSSGFVEAIRDYAKPRDVPAAFQHLVDWHAGLDPVVLLFTAGGRRACAIPAREATRVVPRQPYRCRWSAAR